jgi:choline-sulfatase
LRVPLVLFGPDVPPGLHTQRVRTIDVLPTLLQWLGIPLPRGLDGKSLWPVISADEPVEACRRAFAQAHNCEPDAFTRFQVRLLRTGRKTGQLRHVLLREAVYEGEFKYVRQYYTYQNGIFGLEPEVREQLFKISADLVPRPTLDAEPVPDLVELLRQYNASARRGPKVPSSADLRRYLRDFGYETPGMQPMSGTER